MTAGVKNKITWLGVGTAAVIAVVGWAAPAVTSAAVRAVDARYVRDSAFREFQEDVAIKALTDSLNYAADMRDVRRMLSGLDSSDRCKRGHQSFCR